MGRIYSIDSMKCIAILIVVYFHTVTFNAAQSEEISFSLLAFPRFVIPYFFIVSGFLFGEKVKTNLKKFNYFKSYTFNLIRLFVGWYIFYLFYDLVIGIVFALVRGNSVKAAAVDYIKSLPDLSVIYYGVGDTAYHLWFLTALIWSIGILFLFISINKLHLLLFISFVLNLLGLFGQTYSGIFHLPIDTRDALFFGVFYVSLGSYISKHFERIKPIIDKVKSMTLLYLFLFSCVLQMIESYVTVKMLNGTQGGIGYYLSTIPLTVSLFTLLLKNKNFGKSTIMASIGANTFGIYVTHILFISMSYLTLHFFDLQKLRSHLVFNLVLTLIIFIVSHYYYLVAQNFSNGLRYVIMKEIPSIFKVMILKILRYRNRFQA
ncbi:acyltransferase family protein [Neobacillus muris]|uniref:acyltransferase family protein n=1 Tax=Neobacillus muris TaxID=2941334 RepID=UPI00203F536B|nr:acyltransferase [Neobacillus muris]